MIHLCPRCSRAMPAADGNGWCYCAFCYTPFEEKDLTNAQDVVSSGMQRQEKPTPSLFRGMALAFPVCFAFWGIVALIAVKACQ